MIRVCSALIELRFFLNVKSIYGKMSLLWRGLLLRM